MQRRTPPDPVQLLGTVVLVAVVAVVIHTHQLLIPVLLGLIAWGKLWIKKITPKLALLLFKNSAVTQLRRLAVKASAHLLVKSHRPWRRRITRYRLALVRGLKRMFLRYMALPLWLRTGIAMALLLATAGSSFAVFALLIIPQTLLDWLKLRLTTILQRLGITRFFTALWNSLLPAGIRTRWYLYVKWKLGRRQVAAARSVHRRVARQSAKAIGGESSGLS